MLVKITIKLDIDGTKDAIIINKIKEYKRFQDAKATATKIINNWLEMPYVTNWSVECTKVGEKNV